VKSSSIKTQNNQVMPAGSRLWTPFDLGNLLIGYHSYKSFANSVDGSQPQFWHDLTGNVSLQQDTLSTRPFVRTSSNIGDLPALGFGDSGTPPVGQFMSDTSANLPDIGAGDFFVAGVIRPQSGGPFFKAYTNEVAFGLTSKTRKFQWRCGASGNTVTETDAASLNTVTIFFATRNNTTVEIYRNGVFTNMAGSADTESLDNNNTVSLGATIGTYSQCQVSEIIYGGGAAGSLDVDGTYGTRKRVEGYLAHRCNVASLLPGDHAYRYGPPRK